MTPERITSEIKHLDRVLNDLAAIPDERVMNCLKELYKTKAFFYELLVQETVKKDF